MAKAKATRESKTLEKIEQLAFKALGSVRAGKNPAVEIPVRSLSNVHFNSEKGIIELGDRMAEREFFNTNMAKKFMQTFLVANACRTLVQEGKTISIRQLFYKTKHTMKGSSENTFETQQDSDPIIEDVEVAMEALREELHLFANRRGLIVGQLTVNDAGDQIDLRRMGRGGWGIPSICEDDSLKFVRCDAEYILVVEKQAIWHRLNEDRFWEKHKCILMTTEGQAARGARRMLQRMSGELKIPIYVLVDSDPWGLYIYSVLKRGSINLAYEGMRMAVPSVRYLGMSASDFQKFDLSSAVQIKLNKEDIARAKQIRGYEWFQEKRWQNEIDTLLANGFKMELDGLLTKETSFISDEYVPKKLRDKDWLV
ncbi:MAG: DNA topoisomerase IV subunit A [Deltaproteobacteria bacterium]|nr:DNA topoisomerase IV subunit A [Deltaproteobacteria bacterium]